MGWGGLRRANCMRGKWFQTTESAPVNRGSALVDPDEALSLGLKRSGRRSGRSVRAADMDRSARPSPRPATKSSMAGWLYMTGLGGYLLAVLDNLFKRMTGNERLL